MRTAEALELRHIRLMLAAADQGSLRRAAKAVGLGQPALSRAIQHLEDKIGGSLFERDHTGVRPTLAGRRLIDRVRPLLADLDDAVRAAGAGVKGHEGVVRVGVGGLCPPGFISELATRYAAARPQVQLEFVEGTREKCGRHLRSRRVDVVLSYGLSGWIDVDRARLWSERLYVAGPEGCATSIVAGMTWEQLSQATLMFSRTTSGRDIIDFLSPRLQSLGWRTRLTFERLGQIHLLELVAAGAGVTLIPASMTRRPHPGVSFSPILNEDAQLDYEVVWLAENDNPAMRQLTREVRQLAPTGRPEGDAGPVSVRAPPALGGGHAEPWKIPDPSP